MELNIDTGVEEFSVNGRGVLRFNPADPNLYHRFFAAGKTLEQYDAELTAALGQLGGDEQQRAAAGLALLQDYDGRIKRLLTYYSFTNAAALTVRTAEVPAVTISFAAIEDTSAIFLAQLTADAEPDDAALTLTVHYYLNDQQIENFTPQQRMEAGPHTLALFYPFANVEANTVKRLSVRLVCSGGTVRVAQYGIKATVTGQGMAGETPWNGLLECEELVAPVRLTPRTLVLGPLQDGGAEITKEEPK